jgi:DNA polymerase III delta subunit
MAGAVSPKAPPPVALFYGNQAYAVEQAARRLIDRVLGDGPRDFSFQRFDAAELARAGSAEAGAEALGAFQLACEAAPFLCERWVVRLDRVEAVKVSDRVAQNLLKALNALQLFRCRSGEESAWALEEDLTPDDRREAGAQPQPWVEHVESRSEGPPALHLRPAAAGARCLLAQGGERRLVDVKAFLREKLKGRFVFADELEEDAAGAAGAGPAAGSAGSRLHQALERLLTRPPEGLTLVLTATATREGDLSRALLGKLKGRGPIEKFVTYDDYHPADFVQQGARERGIRLSRPQVELVIQLAGNSQGRLAAELDKLALLFDDGKPPDDAALARAVSGGQGGSLFLVTDKLGSKDLPGALGVLETFLTETPQEHPMLIGILARHTRQLLLVHSLMRLRVPEADWAAQLKLHPFIARKVAAQARRFSELELERMLGALAGLDVAAKRLGHLTGPLFREYLHAVCSSAFAGRPAPGGRPGGAAGKAIGSAIGSALGSGLAALGRKP